MKPLVYDIPYSAASPCPDKVTTTAGDSESYVTDVWLFTDPAAKAAYASLRRIDALREDIQTNVLFDGHWADDELALKDEIARLLAAGSIIAKGTFGYVSPHSTVYRAICEDALQIGRATQSFQPGDDLVFVPWLLRVSRPGQTGPCWIWRLQVITVMCLSCEAFPASEGWCGRCRAALHNTLYPRNPSEALPLNPKLPIRKNRFQLGDKMMVKDVVCGMQIQPETAASKSTYQEQIYYFCSSYCKKKFDLNPAHYVEIERSRSLQEKK